MGNSKVLIGNLLDPKPQSFKLARIIGVNKDMGGQGLISGGNGPSVNVVNQSHAFYRFQFTAKKRHIQVDRRAFQQNMKDFEHQPQGANQDKDTDEYAQNGVGNPPAKGHVRTPEITTPIDPIRSANTC